MSKNRKIKIGIAIGIVAMLAVAVTITKGGKKSRGNVPTGQGTSVIVVKAGRPPTGDIILTIGLTGTMKPSDVVHIYTKTARDVTVVYVEAGDIATQGRVLFKTDTEQAETAKNSMDSASVSLSETQSNPRRTQTLYNGGDLSEQKYEQYASAVKSAQLRYKSAKLTYERQAQYSPITTPINGKIENFDVEIYDKVSQSRDLCMTAGGDESVVSFRVTQRMMQDANVGGELEIQKNRATYRAYIGEISSMADTDTGLLKVKAQIEDIQEIAPGDTVKLNLVTERMLETMVVPIDTIYHNDDNAYVYPYQDGTVPTAQVEVGLEDKGHAQILSGLSADDMVVNTWGSNLYEEVEIQLGDEVQSEETTAFNGEHSKNAKPQAEQKAQPMGLIRLVLKRPVATAMALLCLLVFGISSVFNVTLEQVPDTSQPMLTIMVSYFDASPEDIDELVAQSVEDRVGAIEGVKNMSSTSSENRTMIMLEYDCGTDMDDTYNDLPQSLDALSRQLSDDAETPVMEVNNSARTTMMLPISSPPQEDLYDYVDQTMVLLLEQISSAVEVEAMGGKSEYCKIELQSDEIVQYQVTISDVSTAVSTANLSYPSGDTVFGKLESSMSTSLEHETMEALKKVPITTSSEKIVYLESTARVYEVEESRGGISHYNGEDTISISIIKQQSSTAMGMSSEVRGVIESLGANDENLNIRIVRDNANSIPSSLKDVALTLVLVAVISTIIILIFLGDYKASLIVGGSIPTSMLVLLIPMTSAGSSPSIITMSGLVLGVGMTVNNSIAVLESCFRVVGIEKDKDLLGYAKASLSGTNIVLQSILGSTMTTCVVFLPLIFLQDMSGQIFGSMGYVAIFCMCASFLSAIVIVPLTYMAYKPQERMQAPMSRPMERIRNGYHRIIPGLLKHKVIIVIAPVVIVIVVHFLAGGIETELITTDDTGTVSASIKAGPELLSEDADVMLTQAEKVAKGYPDMEPYMLRYNNDSSTITAYLRDDRDMSTDEIVEQWETGVVDLDNHTVTVETSSSMSFMSRNRGYEVVPNGTDYDELQEVNSRIVVEMTARDDTMNVHFSIGNMVPVVTMKVDPVLAAVGGFTASQTGSQAKQMMDGKEATIPDVNGREVSVIAEYPEDEYRTISRMKDIIPSKPFGGYVALTDVAKIYYKDSPVSTSKTNKAYEIAITADYTGGDVRSAISSEVVSPSLSVTIKKGVNSMNRTMQGESAVLYRAIAITVFLVFVVLSVQFELPRFSSMAMTTMPFGLTGFFGLLQITGASINMTPVLESLILIGMVVNNSIFCVDTVNQYHMTMDLKTPLIKMGVTHLRPIMTTSLTTTLSMIPMTLAIGDNGSTTQGLAIVDIGGLSVSVAVVPFILPIRYALMNDDKKRVVPDI